MIYLEGLRSIIECIYLGDSLGDRLNTCNVYVNPGATKYLTGKTIIINTLSYPAEKIKDLISNGCKVISRVQIDIPEVEFMPYILKICKGIQWNGREISGVNEIGELLDTGLCDFDVRDYKLYFPKLLGMSDTIDPYGNLTGLGWALQQVGMNIKTDTPFINLDIVKTGKVDF